MVKTFDIFNSYGGIFLCNCTHSVHVEDFNCKIIFSLTFIGFIFSLTQHHIRRFNFDDLMTLSLLVSPFLVVVRSALLSMFFLVPVVLGMAIFVLVTMIIVMVRSLLVRSFLAEMVVVFARLVVTFLLLAALLVAVRLME